MTFNRLSAYPDYYSICCIEILGKISKIACLPCTAMTSIQRIEKDHDILFAQNSFNIKNFSVLIPEGKVRDLVPYLDRIHLSDFDLRESASDHRLMKIPAEA